MIVSNFRQNSVSKIDLLFVIDNSLSMGDKQKILAEAVSDLVRPLVDPPCVDAAGAVVERAEGATCPEGTAREYPPVEDMHIGVVTSSLGAYGSELDCQNEHGRDLGYLLGSRPRAASLEGEEFLRWCTGATLEEGKCQSSPESQGGDAGEFSSLFADYVWAAGEQGCAWEATLESWFRFLIDPEPWQAIERQKCTPDAETSQCIGPVRDAAGNPLIDTTLLEQRKRFLRPDSLVAIVMLSDENDCSFQAEGQSWLLATASVLDDYGRVVKHRARRGTRACSADPNSRCCHSCGAAVPEGCPLEVDESGEPVITSSGRQLGEGCDPEFYLSRNETGFDQEDDATNLRCFDQKRRFGVDYLYPIERYVNALRQEELCLLSDDLTPAACERAGVPLHTNPLFDDLSFEARRAQDAAALPEAPRRKDLIFLTGIVGVPWQDLAVDPAARELVYRDNTEASATAIDWSLLLEREGAEPRDPLMVEQVEPRSGQHPITLEPIGPDSDNSVNGREWNIAQQNDLQYACTFPLPDPVVCWSRDVVEDKLAEGEEVPGCDCTDFGAPEYNNPLCAGEDGLSQVAAKAYPSTRQLEVLERYGGNSIVASICPRTLESGAPDYGYRPAVRALIDRLKDPLNGECLQRPLAVSGDQEVQCRIVEAKRGASGCDGARARATVSVEIEKEVRRRMLLTDNCPNEQACLEFQLCEIEPIPAGTREYTSCLSSIAPSGNGWCYVDPDQGLGSEDQVQNCPVTKRRKIRFVGAGIPDSDTVTFYACTGAPTLEGEAMSGGQTGE